MSARKKKSAKPGRLDDVKSVRLGEDLLRRIDELRGDNEGHSEFIRNALERCLMTHRERAIQDCERFLEMHGVTPEELIARRGTKQ